jgi:hypothetical protein
VAIRILIADLPPAEDKAVSSNQRAIKAEANVFEQRIIRM